MLSIKEGYLPLFSSSSEPNDKLIKFAYDFGAYQSGSQDRSSFTLDSPRLPNTLTNFCDTKADTDVDSSKTIYQPLTYWLFYSITQFCQYINGLSIPVGSFFATCVLLWLISSGWVFICVC